MELFIIAIVLACLLEADEITESPTKSFGEIWLTDDEVLKEISLICFDVLWIILFTNQGNPCLLNFDNFSRLITSIWEEQNDLPQSRPPENVFNLYRLWSILQWIIN